MRGLKKAFDFFLFSSLFIAMCAVGMAFQTCHLFAVPHPYLFYGFVFCGTVSSYNFHWGLTPKLFQIPMLPRTGFNRIPSGLHFAIALAALLAAGILFIVLHEHWFWLAGAGLLSLLYTAPKLQTKATVFLRRIAYGKTIFLTLAWTYITAVLPFLIADVQIGWAEILFCVNRFFLIYAICILFDLRDQEADRKEGIKSMITELPARAVTRVYVGSLFVVFFTGLLLLFYMPAPVVTALCSPGLVLAWCYNWFKSQRSAFVYNFILDGLMVFSLPLLLLFRI